ncbi:MAG: DUF5618 family protein [Bacteroidota bacterium]
MSTKEKETRYNEAVRYINNAVEILRTKAHKKDRFYDDAKYVRMACGTAYNGVLLALETYFEIKGVPIENKKSGRNNMKDFERRLSQLDKKLLNEFNTTYNVLHLNGYYEGETKYEVIRSGMDSAIQIINKIKPVGFAGLKLN